MIITIDGPASVGKGTLARKVASFYDIPYFDTGMIYRAVGIKFFINKADINDDALALTYAQELTFEEMMNLSKHVEFRGEAGAKNASIVASYPEVRQALLQMQRDFAFNSAKGVVYDGRDTGTVVCPHADIKFFITASAEVRAGRRHKEFVEKGIDISYEKVLADIVERDKKDSSRAVAPLKPAEDAIIVDTSDKKADEVFAITQKIIDDFKK